MISNEASSTLGDRAPRELTQRSGLAVMSLRGTGDRRFAQLSPAAAKRNGTRWKVFRK
jgi:hypothetical protein